MVSTCAPRLARPECRRAARANCCRTTFGAGSVDAIAPRMSLMGRVHSVATGCFQEAQLRGPLSGHESGKVTGMTRPCSDIQGSGFTGPKRPLTWFALWASGSGSIRSLESLPLALRGTTMHCGVRCPTHSSLREQEPRRLEDQHRARVSAESPTLGATTSGSQSDPGSIAGRLPASSAPALPACPRWTRRHGRRWRAPTASGWRTRRQTVPGWCK